MPVADSFEAPLIFLHVQATGTRTSRDRIIQLAALKAENGRVAGHWHQRFNPGVRVPAGVTELDGRHTD